MPDFESPIEERLYNALKPRIPHGLILRTQVPKLHYRLDMAVMKDNSVLCGVECDGHDYHERTMWQAQCDKKRDRDFLMRGVPVMHFTGSEINTNPDNCAFEVISFVNAMQECVSARFPPPLFIKFVLKMLERRDSD